MGSWGFKSYSNDTTMDFLDDLDKKSPVTILNNAWRKSEEPIEKLGVVIYILEKRKDCQIPLTKIKEAQEIAYTLIEDLEDWKDKNSRMIALVKEIVMLELEKRGRAIRIRG